MSPGGGGGRGGSGTTFTSTDANYIGRNLAPGGPGLSSSITGSPITYAAGGPSGSTAPGCCSNQGGDGTNNRGNGGEGAYWNARGGHGGSGIVVVRYRLYDPIVNVEPIPTQIEVRGRNTCEPNSRQAERALRTAY